jgi:hypothetical protein
MGELVKGWISFVDTNSPKRESAAGFRQLFDLRPMKQKRNKLGYELAVRQVKVCTLLRLLDSGGCPPDPNRSRVSCRKAQYTERN